MSKDSSKLFIIKKYHDWLLRKSNGMLKLFKNQLAVTLPFLLHKNSIYKLYNDEKFVSKIKKISIAKTTQAELQHQFQVKTTFSMKMFLAPNTKA